MGLARRLHHFLRPAGYSPLGSPKGQAHLARWRRWYAAGALGLLVTGSIMLIVGERLLSPGLLTLAGVLGFNALGGWRVVHPPGERKVE